MRHAAPGTVRGGAARYRGCTSAGPRLRARRYHAGGRGSRSTRATRSNLNLHRQRGRDQNFSYHFRFPYGLNLEAARNRNKNVFNVFLDGNGERFCSDCGRFRAGGERARETRDSCRIWQPLARSQTVLGI